MSDSFSTRSQLNVGGKTYDYFSLPTLGQRFVRLRPELPGHGLGLASVRAVMQLHGGSMRLEPAQPGGLRVVLRLPRYRG